MRSTSQSSTASAAKPAATRPLIATPFDRPTAASLAGQNPKLLTPSYRGSGRASPTKSASMLSVEVRLQPLHIQKSLTLLTDISHTDKCHSGDRHACLGFHAPVSLTAGHSCCCAGL